MQRLGRVLARKGRALRALRRGPSKATTYVIVDRARQRAIEGDIELAELAQRLKVLKPWERIDDSTAGKERE